MNAMAAMEELAEKNPALARRAIEPLWNRFDEADDAVKKELLYVFGKLKSAGMLQRLREIQTGPFPAEVREAAAEAIEKITGCNPQ
jgi:hypothetical protein